LFSSSPEEHISGVQIPVCDDSGVRHQLQLPHEQLEAVGRHAFQPLPQFTQVAARAELLRHDSCSHVYVLRQDEQGYLFAD
jgi:hypothetical protein